jgi:Fe-S oxidoreductase/nitrate reductase gamma subunit
LIQGILTVLQEARREAYWPRHVESYGNQIGFLIYMCALTAVLILLIGLYRSARVWFHGTYDREDQRFLSFIFTLIKRVIKNILSRSFPRRVFYGIGAGITKRKSMQKTSFIVHTMIMVGFIGSAIATISLTIHEYLFHEELLVGVLYLLLNILAETSGVLLFIGTTIALARRYIREKDYYDRAGFEDLVLLLLLLWISISGFFVEATRILYGLNNLPIDIYGVEYTNINFEWTAPIGMVLAFILQGVLEANGQIFAVHIFFYLTHLICILTVAIILTFSKFFHTIAGLANIVLADMNTPVGKLNFDADGISKIEDFTFYQLLEASACMKCHFCHNYCPAQDSGEPLSPLKVIQDVKNWGKKQYGFISSQKNQEMLGEKSGLTEDVLWACVTCYACTNSCPHLIGHIDMIVGMRAALIESGSIPATYTTMLESAYQYGNIWNQPKQDRTKWLKEGKLPKIKKSESKLLWLPGDTLAYDPRNQKVARATYDIFAKTGIDYGTFGDSEKNDGNEMRRLGEEALFQMLAEDNIKMYNKRKVQRIVCSSPHTYNTIKNEYSQYGGEFDVVHITQFIHELIEEGRIKFTNELNYEVTYHDPCYLGRYNDIYDIPRKILELLPGVKVKEMPNNKQFSYCCGGGGGGMFRETPEWVEERISEKRVVEAKETLDSFEFGNSENKSKRMIITACPFCTSMLTDATKTKQIEEKIEVKDLVELVLEAMG